MGGFGTPIVFPANGNAGSNNAGGGLALLDKHPSCPF